MSSFMKTVWELLFRVKLFLFGIRFYQCAGGQDGYLAFEAEYRIDHIHRIHFKFYSVECNDVILKKGNLSKHSYKSYVVQAFLNNSFSEEIRHFDGKAFFFNGAANRFKRSDQETIELIMDVYLDFLKKSVSEEARRKSKEAAY